MPVDLYVGGQEHAVLHLLYARFWHKVLFDAGLVHHQEPFLRLVHQGMILGSDGEKMSKSRGNVVSPDDVIRQYGADVLRLYEMFMGPIDAVKPWQTSQMIGCVRFRDRIIGLGVRCVESKVNDDLDISRHKETFKLMNETIIRVTDDINHMHFNRAISALMVYSSHLASLEIDQIPLIALKNLFLLLCPFAPHASEECLSVLMNSCQQSTNSAKDCASNSSWPTCIELDDDNKDADVHVMVQINGKMRGRIVVKPSCTQDEIVDMIRLNDDLKKWVELKTVVKVYYNDKKLISLVVE